ncbi:golgin subfamily A member 2-like isoform X2 [Microplitis mediator]|uniref:golgin subfamily A member 2-like isoform X2 n=1 Tax=Microplitis mediator TaxID=375433 RepID=UPI002556AB50|nr:golgin subfamily A member 2-like isoform X2 [Microplitis mediator]
MNKNDKILAARRKLKKFQQNKQHQETLPGYQNEEESNEKLRGTEMNEADNSQLVKEHGHFTGNNEENLKFLEVDDSKELVMNKFLGVDTVEQELPALPDIKKEFEVSKIDITCKSSSPVEHDSHDNDCSSPSLRNSPDFSANEIIFENDVLQNSLSLTNQQNLEQQNSSDTLLDNNFIMKSSKINPDSVNDNQLLPEDTEILTKLYYQVNQSQNTISELESSILRKDIESNTKFIEEINFLKKNLQVYLQTTNILVAEKANLSKSLSNYQSLVAEKSQTIEDLTRELHASQCRCSEFEKKLHHTNQTICEINKSYQLLQVNYENLNSKFLELEKCYEEQKLETAELQQVLNLKNIDLTNLHQEIKEKNRLLTLAELKIKQLTNETQETHKLEDQNQVHTTFEEQSSQLRESLQTSNAEKLEMFNHYENYVKQLDKKFKSVTEELQNAQTIIKNLKEREENLVQSLSVIEQQYQQEKQKVEQSLSEKNDNQVEYLNEKISSLLHNNESLQNDLSEKEMKIEAMEKEIAELRELEHQSFEMSKLLSALESEQLGASRAISQNQQLKEQLTEIQDAYVTVSNEKLNLTQQLQDELSVKSKLNDQLNELKSEINQLKNELSKKESIISQMMMEKLSLVQTVDQQDFQEQLQESTVLKTECQDHLDSIEKSEIPNQESTSVDKNSGATVDESLDIRNHKLTEESQQSITEAMTENLNNPEKTETHRLDLMTEPITKLEARFKDMMEKVAELTEEKQRLEHLVLQLQGETETIVLLLFQESI